MPRLTAPCSTETPLARWPRLKPMCAMLNIDGSSSWPSARMRSIGTPGRPPRWAATRSRVKRSMPAGTGVCVVNTVPARTACNGLVEGEPSSCDEFADAFDTEEAGVALVGVEHLGRGRAGHLAEGADGAYATDAEQQLLLQAVLASAAVEPVGDLPGRGVVLLDVAVEQQQRDASDVDHPYLRVQRAALGQRQRDAHRSAVGAHQRLASASRPGRGTGSAPAATRPATATGGSTRRGRAGRRR